MESFMNFFTGKNQQKIKTDFMNSIAARKAELEQKQKEKQQRWHQQIIKQHIDKPSTLQQALNNKTLTYGTGGPVGNAGSAGVAGAPANGMWVIQPGTYNQGFNPGSTVDYVQSAPDALMSLVVQTTDILKNYDHSIGTLVYIISEHKFYQLQNNMYPTTDKVGFDMRWQEVYLSPSLEILNCLAPSPEVQITDPKAQEIFEVFEKHLAIKQTKPEEPDYHSKQTFKDKAKGIFNAAFSIDVPATS